MEGFIIRDITRIDKFYKVLTLIEEITPYCFVNRKFINKSEKCGCIKCHKIFNSNTIMEWSSVDSAICPHCKSDRVLGSYSTHTLNEGILILVEKYFNNTLQAEDIDNYLDIH